MTSLRELRECVEEIARTNKKLNDEWEARYKAAQLESWRRYADKIPKMEPKP